MQFKGISTDQTKVCGLGNIYASEAMRFARHPQTSARINFSGKDVPYEKKSRYVLKNQSDTAHRPILTWKHRRKVITAQVTELRWLVYDREREACAPNARANHAAQTRRTFDIFCPQCQKCQLAV